MSNLNQTKQSINNFSATTNSIELFEPLCDEQAETIKGGFNKAEFMSKLAGDLNLSFEGISGVSVVSSYCKVARAIKTVTNYF